MYKCLSCGKSFTSPAVIEEMHYELTPPAAEYFRACPFCRDFDIVPSDYVYEGATSDSCPWK